MITVSRCIKALFPRSACARNWPPPFPIRCGERTIIASVGHIDRAQAMFHGESMMVGWCLFALAWCSGFAADAAPLPEGPGLATAYPGDRGIAKDPAVLFAEDFEEGTLSEVVKRWDSASDKD